MPPDPVTGPSQPRQPAHTAPTITPSTRTNQGDPCATTHSPPQQPRSSPLPPSRPATRQKPPAAAPAQTQPPPVAAVRPPARRRPSPTSSARATGRDRNQILDRDWKVCTQNPAAGTKTSTDTKLDFGTVKLAETCPATDQKAPAEAGATMPNFAGKSVKAARASLDSSTSITVKDATGEDRFILVESNWKVCTQDPKAGANLNGQPVTFTAVKYEETCP